MKSEIHTSREYLVEKENHRPHSINMSVQKSEKNRYKCSCIMHKTINRVKAKEQWTQKIGIVVTSI